MKRTKTTDQIKKILAERVDGFSSEYLIGTNTAIIDCRHSIDDFEEQMIYRLDNIEEKIEQQEIILANLVNLDQLTDDIIIESIKQMTDLPKSQIVASLFRKIYPNPESNSYIKARFFPEDEEAIVPVTFRAMRKQTSRSVRTNWLRVEEAQKAILMDVVSRYPLFVQWATTARSPSDG